MAECEPIKVAHKKLAEALLQVPGERELEVFTDRKAVRNLIDSIEELASRAIEALTRDNYIVKVWKSLLENRKNYN